MTRTPILGAIAAVSLAGSALAQRQPLPSECRSEILRLCPMGGGLRQCVAAALPRFSDPCRTTIAERAAQREMPAGMRELAYGADARQKLDFSRPLRNRTAPLIVHIHGGGWSIGDKRSANGAKPEHFNGLGWAFASLNYRLVPAARVEQQAADIASAIAFLRAHAIANGLDPDRIVLMGHSAGAHLAALVASDPQYLRAAGVPMAAVRGVILLDGAGYDVARQMARADNMVPQAYDAAFGKDVARQKALSPALHAAAPNVANWLILPIKRRADSQNQSRALAEALTQASAKVTLTVVPGESHASLNAGLGTKGDFATAEVDRFLATIR